MASEKIKRTWIVCGDITDVECEGDGVPKEFKTAAKAVAYGKAMVKTTENTEAWVYGLTHVIARPDTEPTVDVIK